MSALEVAKGQAEDEHTDLGSEQDKADNGPEDFIYYRLDIGIDVQAGQAHGNDTAQHTEYSTDPYQAVEAQEDRQICGVQFETSSLEQDAEESQEQEVRDEYEYIPQTNAESKWLHG